MIPREGGRDLAVRRSGDVFPPRRRLPAPAGRLRLRPPGQVTGRMPPDKLRITTVSARLGYGNVLLDGMNSVVRGPAGIFATPVPWSNDAALVLPRMEHGSCSTRNLAARP